MTTTSAGNGPSAGDGREENDGGWSWFAPARPATEAASRESEEAEQARPAEQERPGTREQAPPPGPAAQAQPPGAAPQSDPAGPPPPVSPVVTGTGGGRAGWAETPEEAAIPVPSPPGDGPSDDAAAPAPGAPAPGAPDPNSPYAPGAFTPAPGPGAGQRGAPAPGPWPGGPETAREHPAPSPAASPYGTAAPDAGQAPAQTRTRPRPTAPPQQPPSGPGRRDRPSGPLYDEATAAAAPPPAKVESNDAALIRRTLEEIEPRADAATAYFYALLFVQQPHLRELFPASMDTQRDRLFRALLTAVRLADEVEALSEYLAGLGRGHRKYGTLPEHYPAVGECLLGAIAQYAPESWSQEAEDAWVRAYTTISQAMIDAAAEDAQHAPAWWNAEIVSHELRTSEIAVITLRTDQPYPFLAGQYTSVETPWWPRVWRHYSFASSPRSDGLLVLHVKAVPTGWVSNALVHRARPGDVVRLGPPAGNMTVDHVTDSGLLCVGGGTGIAPIRALVEDVAEHGRDRPVEVFYGARSDHDLYDLDTMMQLERQHRWLSVRPVVATPPGSAFANALAGQLPDAVRQYGPWSEYDGYLSGPPGMIRSGVDALVASGVPAERIRHDSLADLIASGAQGSG